MPRRTGRFRSPGDAFCLIITFTIALGLSTLGAIFYSKDTIVPELLSRITDDTPISGFYGPGSWWAWLITLGMTHGHMVVGLAKGEESDEWDYDLLGASGYIIAAAIDLIHKSRTIARLGDAASESPLLPALFCAEQVVSIGTGSSLFTVVTALSFVRGRAGPRRAVIAILPLFFVLVASWFTLRAHQAVFRTGPVMWCRLHDGKALKGDEPLPTTAADFLASLIYVMRVASGIYTSWTYWVYCGITSTLATVFALLGDAAEDYRIAFAILLPIIALFPLIVVGFILVHTILAWLCLWVVCWAAIYILAFFPQMGYFPLTKISITDMDQLAALLGVGFIAAFRSGRRILEALRYRADFSSSTLELGPLYVFLFCLFVGIGVLVLFPLCIGWMVLADVFRAS